MLSLPQLGFGCMLLFSKDQLPTLPTVVIVCSMLVKTAMQPFARRSDVHPSRGAVVKVSLWLLYSVTALIVPLFAVRRYLPERWWWTAGLAAEFVAIGIPIAALLLVSMRHGAVKPGWMGRFAMLLASLLGVIFAVIVIPCAIVAFGTDASSTTVSVIWILCTFGFATIFWALSRY
jgi:hypothetical protein